MKNFDLKNITSLFIASLSLGWIIGNSISPVVSIVISGLMTIFIAVLTTLIGIDLNNVKDSRISEIKINLLPFGIFCFCIALGGSIGIYSKENLWLGSKIKHGGFAKNDIKQEKKTNLDENQESIGFKNENTDLCLEIQLHYDNLKLLKELLKVKLKYDTRVSETFVENIVDSTILVNYAKSVCE